MTNMDSHSFVKKTLDLLDKERDAEIEETISHNERLSAKELQGKGVCLLKLEIKSRRHGMYGRLVVAFEPENKQKGKDSRTELPSNSFSPGDIVGVNLTSSDLTEKPVLTGIVSQINSYQISVAFDESQDVFGLDDDSLFRLIKLANDVTYKRLKKTLNDLDKFRGGPCESLVEILFGSKKVSDPNQILPVEFVNGRLDESQKAAVKFGLSQKELAVIHGPPGTGKTTTVVELIVQAVRQGQKVLAAAPSNIAVDNMVEKLASFKQKIVRIGHPARLLEHLQKYSLDAIVAASEEKGLAKDVRSDMEKILKKLKKSRSGGEKAGLRAEMKSLQKELYQREKAATAEVLSRADVVLVTLTSASSDGPLKHVKDDHFDLVVVDECSQALEAACWIAIMRARKCVLAGDHLQLPPTIMSKEAARNGLDLSLMERILNTFAKEEGSDLVRMLTTQYRMHSDIMTWSSDQLYEGKLTAHSSVASHLLSDLEEVTQTETTEASLLLIDTCGCDLYESDLPEDVSKGNEGEADIVAAHVKELIASGLRPHDIAVISPYNLQIDYLRVRLSHYMPHLEVKSVDGFQGREKEAVVISMVRSNTKGEVGFLAERRRINVAVTRARRHLTVVCDTATVSSNAFLKSLVDYMSERGVVTSAHDFSHEINAVPSVSTRQSDASKKSSKQQQKQHKAKPETLLSKEEKIEKYEAILSQFKANDNKKSMSFPPSLNSHDRMVVHEVSERLGLYHTSTGEDKTRHIKISKTPIVAVSEEISGPLSNDVGQLSLSDESKESLNHPDDSSSNLNVSEDEITAVDDSTTTITIPKQKEGGEHLENGNNLNLTSKDLSTVSTNNTVDINVKEVMTSKDTKQEKVDKAEVTTTTTKTCPFCHKVINVSNFDLHTLHCSRLQKQQQEQQQTNSMQTQSAGGARKKESNKGKNKKTAEVDKEKKPKEKSLCKVRKAEDVLKNIDGDDFDAMLNSIKQLDGKCAFKKCKTLTNVLGSNCKFCALRFCLGHIMPEIHGCGDAAKTAARQTTCREGVLYRGSGVPSHKPNATKRAQLERRLEKKMDEVSQKRNKKKKDSSS